MFSYYGSKSKVIKLYPNPTYNTIIEPFAGSARYALRYWEHQVCLYDVDKDVVDVWEWLIGKATPSDILNMPMSAPGERIPQLSCKGASKFLAFMSNQGSAIPKKTTGRMGFSKWNRQNVAELLPRIKHWTIERRSYVDISNQSATWFVDPPYQRKGKYYRHNDINFDHLGRWCRNRNGQVIVCENEGADWLPFQFLTSLRGQNQKSTEVVWVRET